MRKHYIRTLHKVIDESDIVILVLDARDPEGCRSKLVEEEEGCLLNIYVDVSVCLLLSLLKCDYMH